MDSLGFCNSAPSPSSRQKKKAKAKAELRLVLLRSPRGDVRSPRGTCALCLACAHLRTHKISLGSGVIGLHGSQPPWGGDRKGF